jgi:hypothetical protein
VIFVSLFIPMGIGETFNAIMGTYWGHLLNFAYLFQLILEKGFGNPERLTNPHLEPQVPVALAWTMMIFVCLLSLFIINSRLRAREVVRG